MTGKLELIRQGLYSRPSWRFYIAPLYGSFVLTIIRVGKSDSRRYAPTDPAVRAPTTRASRVSRTQGRRPVGGMGPLRYMDLRPVTGVSTVLDNAGS
jgi:hypothetical protein